MKRTVWHGTHWREFRIYEYGRHLQTMAEVVLPCLADKTFNVPWHYLNHWEGGPHLRIRFSDQDGVGEKLHDQLRAFSSRRPSELASLSSKDYALRARNLASLEGLEEVPPLHPLGVFEAAEVFKEPLIESFTLPSIGFEAFRRSSECSASQVVTRGMRVRTLTETLLITLSRYNLGPQMLSELYSKTAASLGIIGHKDPTIDAVIKSFESNSTPTVSVSSDYASLLPPLDAYKNFRPEDGLRFWHLHLNRLGFSIDEEAIVALSLAASYGGST